MIATVIPAISQHRPEQIAGKSASLSRVVNDTFLPRPIITSLLFNTLISSDSLIFNRLRQPNYSLR